MYKIKKIEENTIQILENNVKIEYINYFDKLLLIDQIKIEDDKKFKLKDNQLIQDAFNLNTMDGLRKFIKHVFVGTLILKSGNSLHSFSLSAIT